MVAGFLRALEEAFHPKLVEELPSEALERFLGRFPVERMTEYTNEEFHSIQNSLEEIEERIRTSQEKEDDGGDMDLFLTTAKQLYTFCEAIVKESKRRLQDKERYPEAYTISLAMIAQRIMNELTSGKIRVRRKLQHEELNPPTL